MTSENDNQHVSDNNKEIRSEEFPENHETSVMHQGLQSVESDEHLSVSAPHIIMNRKQQSTDETVKEMETLDKTTVTETLAIDTLLYQIENRISSNPEIPFLFLAF